VAKFELFSAFGGLELGGMETNAQHLCPRCGVALSDVQVAGTTLEECLGCGGIWIAQDALAGICSSAESQAAVEAMKVPAAVAVDSAKRYLKCPACVGLMGPMNYAGGSGIIVHVCRGHGVWLDRDEMHRIIEFVRSGKEDKVQKDQFIRAHDRTAGSWGDAGIHADVFHGIFGSFLS
jgi:Zn-finger nucleic acid-binding protein